MDIKASKIRSWRLVALFATLLMWIFAQGIQEVYSYEFPSVPHELAPVPFEDEVQKPWKIAYDIDSHKIIIDFSPLNSFKSLKDKVKRDISKFIEHPEIVLKSFSLKEVNLQLNPSEEDTKGSKNNNWKISYSDDDLSTADSSSFNFSRLDKIIIPYERFNDLQKVETVSIELKINLIFTNQGKLDNAFIISTYTHKIGSEIKEAFQDQIIKYSHQILDLHYLDTSNSSDGNKRRRLMPIALAGLAYEVATIAATDAAVTLNSLAILLVGLKSLQSHTCNNSAYAYNQKEVCKSVSGNNRNNERGEIIKSYTTVAELFHEDSSSKLRMIESDKIVVIYFPDGNNIALPRDTIESEYNLLQKYNKFKEYFTKTANFDCNNNDGGRQCGLFTYSGENRSSDNRELSDIFNENPIDSDKVFQFFNEGTHSVPKIVMYHKNSLICDVPTEVHRRLMRCSGSKTRQTWNIKAVVKGYGNKSHETGMRWCDDEKSEDCFNQDNSKIEIAKRTASFGCGCGEIKQAEDKYNQEPAQFSEKTEFDVDRLGSEEKDKNLERLAKTLLSKSKDDSCDYLIRSSQSSKENTVDFVSGHTSVTNPPKQPCLHKPPQKNKVEDPDCNINEYFHGKSNASRAKNITTKEKVNIINTGEEQKDTKQDCCYNTGTGCSMQ